MYKKLFTFLPLMVLSLLLFPKLASAVTLRYTQADFDFVISPSFNSFINSQNTSTGSFFIMRRWFDGQYYYIKTSDTNITSLSCSKDGNAYVSCPYSPIYNVPRYIISNDFTLTQNGNYTLQVLQLDGVGGSGNYYLMYSSIDTITITGSESVTITDDINSITCNVGDTCPYLSAYNFYNYFYGDNTPLLSSFVSTTIDSLAYICEFITSSYIYLSIFVVFILTFVVLLVRRFR